MRKARPFPIIALLLAATSLAAAAQEAPASKVAEDAAALVKRREERLRSLDRAAKERDEALGFLSKQVEAAQGAIDGGDQAQAALRQGAAALSNRLDAVAQERERLSSDSASGMVTIEQLQQQLAALNLALGNERDGRAVATSAVADLQSRLATLDDREKALTGQVGERDRQLADLQRQVAALSDALGSERTGRASAAGEAAELRRRLEASAAHEQQLAATVGQRDQALADLQNRVAALETSLGSERSGRADAQGQIAALRGQVESGAKREAALVQGVDERNRIVAELQERLKTQGAALDAERKAGAQARDQVAALRADVAAGGQREQALGRSLADQAGALAELQRQVAALGEALEVERSGREQAAGEVASLRARLAAGGEREQALGQSVADKDGALAELQRQVAALGEALGVERSGREQAAGEAVSLKREVEAGAVREKELTGRADEQEQAAAALRQDAEKAAGFRQAAEAEAAGLRQEAEAKAADVARLAQEVAGLRAKLRQTQDLLGGERQVSERQETQIAALSSQLKAAMESEIQELSQYRSEFFGRLRQALGERGDVRIVGDRFVFQAEVLFGSGSARLGQAGEDQLRQLARTLQEVAPTIPPDVGWILRVDGHTDRIPISNELFASNWELSSARAIAVVEFLVRQGIPPERLAAAGFGEYQPLDASDDEIAFRRNRRIEFKLTER